jgi:NAD(P)H-dependent FMN reductase
VLLVCGSTRAASTNRAALLTARAVAPDGIACALFDRLAELPHFNPDDEEKSLPPLVRELRRAIGDADAVLFSTPEYAGTLPGSFKNLLDWTVGGGEMNEKPCAWINAAPAGRGDGAAATLGTVLGYLGARVISEGCIAAPIGRDQVGADGLVSDTPTRAAILRSLQILTSAATLAD